MIVYVDLNVFEGMKNLNPNHDHLDTYRELHKLVRESKILIPYSSAHINDLHRGYLKNPAPLANDLGFIRSITDNLCIVQYWGQESAVWHKRDIFDFFVAAEAEKKNSIKPWSQLLNTDGTFKIIDAMWEFQKKEMEAKPLNLKAD